jgi:hypothetical protein
MDKLNQFELHQFGEKLQPLDPHSVSSVET